nr:hypothetical protein [Treponema putidum]
MEDNGIFTRHLVILFLLLLFPLTIFAQNAEDKSSNTEESNAVKKNYVIETEGKKRFFIKLFLGKR